MSKLYQIFFQKKFHPVFLLLILAAALILWGIVLQENEETRRNAHYLCLDCIGIG